MAEDNNTDTTAKAAKAKAPVEEPRLTRSEKVAASVELAEADRAMRAEPADIAPASSDDIAASGAIIEPSVTADIDVDHPAVDNAPRAGTTVLQNKIDFNDPDLTPSEAVAANLKAQD